MRSEEGGGREELGRRGTACRALGEEGGCLVGLLFFAPVASRVSARQPSYFFLLRQKKVTKKKASHVRAASRCLALLAAFGTLANSLRSNSASVLIRTLLRCSARPNGGGIPHGSSASRTSPEWLVRCAHIAGGWVASFLTPHFSQGHGTPCPYMPPPHSSLFTSRHGQPQGLPLRPLPLTKARHAVPLRPLPLAKARHAVPLRPLPLAKARHAVPLRPHPSLLTPHSYDLTPTPSPLTPTTSPLTPTTSPLTPTTSPLTPTTSLLTPTTSLLRPQSSPLTPTTSLLRPHSSLLRPPQSARKPDQRYRQTGYLQGVGADEIAGMCLGSCQVFPERLVLCGQMPCYGVNLCVQ